MISRQMKRQRSLFKILLLLILFLFAASPGMQENLHRAFVHQKKIAHSHGPDGTVHYHGQKQQDSTDRSGADRQQHSFKNIFLVFVRGHVTPATNSSNKMFPLAVLGLGCRADLFRQAVFKFSTYRGPPESILCTCQQIVLSHPNKAPPLA
jgi:hypothetical protein